MDNIDQKELKKRRPINFLAMIITVIFIILTIFLLNDG